MSLSPESNNLCDIGFIGLGVMGKNLALNLADNGYKIAAFDLEHQKIEEAIAQDKTESGTGGRIIGCSSYTELLAKLSVPHLIILSIPAGHIIDDVCHKLIDAGIKADDIIVDMGNSLWTDTVRREKEYEGQFFFFSTAVSGGEVGARFGPSLMPSGDRYAWARIEPVWHAIAAKVDPDTGRAIERFEPGNPVKIGDPCATYIGPGGAGHYVKMVHNGIEYADMQLICEAYHVMREGLAMSPQEIGEVFSQWNEGVLESYLIEISAEVLKQEDSESGQPLVDIILDKAGQKGTGLWTAVSSLEIGSPAPTIAQAVYARSLSTLKDDRVTASKLLQGPKLNHALKQDKQSVIQCLHDALYCAKICAYAQGFQLMQMASDEHGWSLDFANIAKIWRAGCIIRAAFLQSITDAYSRNENLHNLLLDPFFIEQINIHQANWRQAIANATLLGIPCGAFSSAIAYYDSYRCETLPANLLQAQRDFFGAHTFERVDQPSGKKFHVEWASKDRPIVTA
ncbi:NADP-dependent phosphogluconate dehydrogenase [Aliikangiella coralliicola]|uniref:6-phosphogluconate dehydrogenase, decarboxylating n=1 Tax=Aliikangiella coralliicola TaxID=2592383 RepID=A0A545UEP1_9GAMM|nr:NADP-dependent phosphogluconate dehydrogenase [Aliikangiella coralliicola]TQV87949.1 NADP-dependent phosphogluconate dehydrogenase [Aliikangiella coralliicola]